MYCDIEYSPTFFWPFPPAATTGNSPQNPVELFFQEHQPGSIEYQNSIEALTPGRIQQIRQAMLDAVTPAQRLQAASTTRSSSARVVLTPAVEATGPDEVCHVAPTVEETPCIGFQQTLSREIVSESENLLGSFYNKKGADQQGLHRYTGDLQSIMRQIPAATSGIFNGFKREKSLKDDKSIALSEEENLEEDVEDQNEDTDGEGKMYSISTEGWCMLPLMKTS